MAGDGAGWEFGDLDAASGEVGGGLVGGAEGVVFGGERGEFGHGGALADARLGDLDFGEREHLVLVEGWAGAGCEVDAEHGPGTASRS